MAESMKLLVNYFKRNVFRSAITNIFIVIVITISSIHKKVIIAAITIIGIISSFIIFIVRYNQNTNHTKLINDIIVLGNSYKITLIKYPLLSKNMIMNDAKWCEFLHSISIANNSEINGKYSWPYRVFSG